MIVLLQIARLRPCAAGELRGRGGGSLPPRFPLPRALTPGPLHPRRPPWGARAPGRQVPSHALPEILTEALRVQVGTRTLDGRSVARGKMHLAW